MSSQSSDRNAIYAAAQGREFLRGELQDKPNRWVREFAGMVTDPRTLDLLNYYCGLYEERGEDFLTTPVGRKILRDAATRTTDEAFEHGNVSQLQGMVGLTQQERDGGEALERTVDELAVEGTVAVVCGPPGSGKTAFTLDVARGWGARTGGRLIGNTTWDGYDSVVGTDLEMLREMASHEGPALGVVDEAVQNLTGRGADSKKAEKWANRMTFVRKKEREHGPHAKRGSVLTVAHNWDRMNAPTRRMATLVISKPSKTDPGKVVLYRSEGGEDSREKIDDFTGVTDTRESYPEHEASSFDVVLDGDLEDDEDDGPDPEDVARDEAIRTAVRAAKPWTDDDGMSYRQIGRKNPQDDDFLVDYSTSWVGDRVREWKEGQHRDLVDAPEGATA